MVLVGRLCIVAASDTHPFARTGLALRDPIPWHELVLTVETAEQTGYEALFLPEITGREVFATLAGLSRATYRKMIQNLVWATAYNIVAIPVAAGLFVRWGFDLPMSVGAIAMSLSTIIVAANAQLLRGLKLQQES